jgi:ABC-type branched-subunit amino acid transport system substrate-binding protein
MQTPSRCAWLLAAGITASLTLHAQENSLTIGASLPLSGSQAEAGKEGMSIMQAQVEAFNKQEAWAAKL